MFFYFGKTIYYNIAGVHKVLKRLRKFFENLMNRFTTMTYGLYHN